MPDWGKLSSFLEETYDGTNDAWIDRLRSAITEEYTSEERRVQVGDTINIAQLKSEKGHLFISECNPSDLDASLQRILENITQEVRALSKSDRARTTKLWISISIMALQLTFLLLIYALLRQKNRNRHSEPQDPTPTHFRKTKDGLEKRLQDLAIHLQRLESSIEKLSKVLPQESPWPNQQIFTAETSSHNPSVSPRLETLSRSSPKQEPVGTGTVSKLQELHSTSLQPYIFEGTTQRFCRSESGDYLLDERERLVIPRASRIRRPIDWYPIGNGFDFDNRTIGALHIDTQPVIRRQSDGSYLLESKGQLRAVQDE